MKKILIPLILLIVIFFGCKKTQKDTSQQGVFKLDKLTVSLGGKDSVYARTQFKIYTDSHFMYASLAPDSSVGFGVGYFKPDTGGRLIEYNIYSSRALDSTQIFHLIITKKDSGYTQVIPLTSPKGAKYSITEVYNRVPGSGTSKLDGLWKLDSAYTVKGKDTTRHKETQYKAYWASHFMFVHRYPVTGTTNFKNGFGYGDFTLKNDTVSESENVSSHSALTGRTFAVKIKFVGDDEYRQVITDEKTGEQSVEIYKKLK